MKKKVKFKTGKIDSHEAIIALELFIGFLDSLPEGWLAHTCGDIGLLNMAYIHARKAGMIQEG